MRFDKRLASRVASSTLVTLMVVAGQLAGCGRALIHPASVLAGPSSSILEVAGAAMARDGSGGILYRQQVEGVSHVFVVPFRNGAWGTPVQVDTEDLYGASEPAIAAGEGGRLLVVWVQPRNVSIGSQLEYELMSASMPPEATGFGQAIAVDTNVGEPDTGDISGVDPRLAMAPDGQAYVVYRVRLDDCANGFDESNPERPKCRQGTTDKVVAVRAAYFDYLTWTSLGELNRAPQIAMRDPTATNAPSVGIALNGNGVVAWQEPESGDVARIWVRRLFGATRGEVLQASPSTVGGQRVTSDADAPAVAVGPYGSTRVAFRILGDVGSAVETTQLYTNFMLSEIAPHGSELQGAAPVSDGAGGNLQPPSDAVASETRFSLAWNVNGEVHALEGGGAAGGLAPITFAAGSGAPLSAINPSGGGTTAWSAPITAPPGVEVREDYAAGAFQTGWLAGGVPGAASDLTLGGDGQGDALIGFMQGPVGRAEVMGAFVQAPPQPFVVNTSASWVRGGKANVSWEGAIDSVAGITYSVYVDGRARMRGLKRTSAKLSAVGLGDGVHQVQVLATDAAGQQTMSPRAELKVDANPPVVRVRLIDHRHGVRVSVRDDASGVNAGATRISFGDGGKARGGAHAAHRYRRAGLYTITARVRDNVGNGATVRLRVRVL